MIGAGTYEIRPKNVILSTGGQINIEKCNLKDFTLELLKQDTDFVNALYTKLFTEATNKTFQFKSLYTILTVLTKFKELDDNDKYNTISIEVFNNLIAGTNIDMKYISSISSFDSTKTLCKRYATLKEIYDSILSGLARAKETDKVTEASKQPEIEILNNIYKNFPLSKINPNLPSLITLFSKQLIHTVWDNSSVYSVTFNGKKCELKVKHYDTLNQAEEFMQNEVIKNNIYEFRACHSMNGTWCTFISAYCDFTTNLIYVLMESV